MKYFLLYLLFCLPLYAANVTWRSPATSVQVKAPAMPTGGGYIYGRIYVNGQDRSGAGVAQVVASGQTVTVNISAQSVTADEAASVRVVLYYDAYNSSTNVNVFWLQMSKLQPPISTGGPFNSDGQPVDANGDPVDDQGKPIVAPPKRHYASAEYTNSNPFPVTVQIIYTCSTEGLILQRSANVEAGSRYFVDGYHDHPFTITLQPMADGNPIGPPITGPSEPVDENDPEVPPMPDPGQPGGVGGPPSSGGGQRPGTGQVGTPDPVPDQPRPGTGEGNADARNKELRAELQRIVAQINAAANQAANDADRTNDLLDGIKTNTGKTASNTDGLGEGEGNGNGNGTGAPLNLTPAGTAPGSDSNYVDPGWTGKLNSLRLGASRVLESAQGLGASLGLNVQPGQAPLKWTINVPKFGAITLDLDAMLGGFVEFIRNLFLFVFSLYFVQDLLKEISAAFA